MNSLFNGFKDFFKSFKEMEYRKILKWGVLSALFSTICLLTSSYLIDMYSSPLFGYLLKSIVSGIIFIPVFVSAYFVIEEKKSKIASFFSNVFSYYLWGSPLVIMSTLSGIMMIFFNSFILFSLPLVLSVIYIVIFGIAPFYIETYGLKESLSISAKVSYKNIKRVLPVIGMNIILLFVIFGAINLITIFLSKENVNVGFIFGIIIALLKPLLYALPLFNALTFSKKIIKEKELKENENKDEVGDII